MKSLVIVLNAGNDEFEFLFVLDLTVILQNFLYDQENGIFVFYQV